MNTVNGTGGRRPPFFVRRAHEVWFEDARSSLAKYRLVTEYGLCGIGYWNFMRPFTAGFALLNAVFRLEP